MTNAGRVRLFSKAKVHINLNLAAESVQAHWVHMFVWRREGSREGGREGGKEVRCWCLELASLCASVPQGLVLVKRQTQTSHKSKALLEGLTLCNTLRLFQSLLSRLAPTELAMATTSL